VGCGLGLAYRGLLAGLVCAAAYGGTSESFPQNFSQDGACVQRFIVPFNATLDDYLHYTVTNGMGQALAGRLRIDGHSLFVFPEMDEPLFVASGNPPVFARGVYVTGNEIVLTYVLPLPERKGR
jgi:hypothetical protein